MELRLELPLERWSELPLERGRLMTVKVTSLSALTTDLSTEEALGA